MFTVYRASHADTNDGSGDVEIGYFMHEEDAHAVAGQFFVMGVKDAPCGSVRRIEVYDNLDQYEHYEREHARKRALSRLTPEEARLLGLTR